MISAAKHALPERIQDSINLANHRLQGHLSKYVLSWLTQDDAPSDIPITLMVPLAPKDVERARRSIPRMIKHLVHPIEKTVIIAPDHPEVRRLCRDLGVDYVDELDPLTSLLGDDVVKKMNGWYRQQILKLISPSICGSNHVVSIDSDTYPIRPTAFLTPDGKPILQLMPRDSIHYQRFTEVMIGKTPYSRRSFIAHCMIFRQVDVDQLYSAIEAVHGVPWIDALLETLDQPLGQPGMFSEFDLLAHCLVRDRPDKVHIRNCANLKITHAEFMGEKSLPARHRRFRFVSNHQHGN